MADVERIHREQHAQLALGPSVPTQPASHVMSSKRRQLFLWTRKTPDWRNLGETFGSDHCILEITVPLPNRQRSPKHGYYSIATELTDWDAFRKVTTKFQTSTLDAWNHSLRTAHRQTTKTVQRNEDNPQIDGHLVTLWDKRHALIRRWKRNKLNKRLRARIEEITQEAQEYADKLATDNWLDICESAVCHRNLAARTSAPEASPVSPDPDQLQGMATVAARMRYRRRKLMPELSFGSTSGGPSSLPCNTKANLLEFFALLKAHLKPDVPGNATEAAASEHCSKDGVLATSETTPRDKCEARSSHTTEPLKWRKCEASASEIVVVETSFPGEHEIIVNEEPEVVDTLRQRRERLQEKGPSQEDDLLEAPKRSQCQLILEVYGALTTFRDRRLGFGVVHEDPYAFVYHHGPDDVDACFSTSLLQDGATTVCLSDRSNCSGRQHEQAIDGGPRFARFSSSSISAYDSAVVFLQRRKAAAGGRVPRAARR
ncbi:hypothetical protein HPB49_018968 [Dermacentor silvarum]|uniref:Uncharacterized protein n=1 Tax=Dermacentor silvarum TaxID=543639 RepID=A0ACB8D7R0_DERSI|nr:hypothetical protein HPB49_018968 [Dermacentor silvarum]